jgi:hypothetical protein
MPRAGFYNVGVKLRVPLLVLLVIAPSARSEGDEKEKEKERARVVFHFTEVKPGGSAEKALAEYNKWVNDGADPAKLPKTMEAMYKAAGGGATSFKKIAHLIAKGLEPGEVADKSLKHLQIDEAHSKQMAKIREANIERIVEDILKSKKGEWKIGRSDSGNPSSGMKSDLDQTLYVLKKGPNGQWVRDLNADKLFIQELNRRWKAKFPHLSLAAMDIASIEGKQRFPDPRDVHLDFEGKFLETIDTLRRTPGAYTYPGAVVSQMQLRALLAVLQDTPRSFMEYELGEDGKMKKLPFNRDFAQRILFGIRPALMPGHAYGAAVANYLTLQTYIKQGKIDPKYHLRVWDDCGQVLAAVEGKLRKGLHEYIDLPADERARRNKMIVDAMFADPVKRKLHKLALDASADLRLIHKGGEENLKRVFGDKVPPPAAHDAKVFDKLARALNDLPPTGDPAPTAKQIKSAVAEHRRLASEYCLESVYRSSVEAYKVYNDVRFNRPISVEGYHHLMRAVKEADWPKTRMVQERQAAPASAQAIPADGTCRGRGALGPGTRPEPDRAPAQRQAATGDAQRPAPQALPRDRPRRLHGARREGQHRQAQRARAEAHLHGAGVSTRGRRRKGRPPPASQETQLEPGAVRQARAVGSGRPGRARADRARVRVERRRPGARQGGRPQRADLRHPCGGADLLGLERRRAGRRADGGSDPVPALRHRAGRLQHRRGGLRHLRRRIRQARPQQRGRRDLPRLLRARHARL